MGRRRGPDRRNAQEARSSAVKIILNIFGPEMVLKRDVSLELSSPTFKEVLGALKGGRFMKSTAMVRDDLSLAEGCVALVNGRNILSLNGYETPVRDGDEVTLSVLVAGG